MLAFTVRRILISIPILILSSILVFLMVSLSGDPLSALKSRNPQPPPEVFAARRETLGLNGSLPHRYWHWLSNFVTGDFGKEISGASVRADLMRRSTVTLRMIILAMLLAVIFAIIAGVISAVRQYTGVDYLLTFFGFLFLSMPAFWLASLLKEFLAIDINKWVGHKIFYTVGPQTPDLKGGFFHNIPDYLGHLALPTLALAAISYAAWSRFQRASMLDVLNSDYVRLARAKGLSRPQVMIRHALRTALIPLTTAVAIDIGAVLGGAVITERVFSWHGLGEMLLNGITNLDINVVLAWLMVSAIFVVVFNLIADLLYAVLDPRIRYA
jgi:peptide/nickel transport system permease protein